MISKEELTKKERNHLSELVRDIFYNSYQIGSITLHKEEKKCINETKNQFEKYTTYEVWYWSAQTRERRCINITEEQYKELEELMEGTYCYG